MTTATEEITNATIENIRTTRTNTDVMAFLSDSAVSGSLATQPRMTHTAEDRWPIWNTETGERVLLPVNMLRKTLVKRRAGKVAFIAEAADDDGNPDGQRPAGVPVWVMGGVMCYLHPDHPDRKKFDAMGLSGRFCGDVTMGIPPAAHLASEYDRDQHMAHRHRREWGVIKNALEEEGKREDREIQRESIQAMMALAKQRQGVSDAPAIFYCDAEGCSRFFDSAQGKAMHMSRDHKEG